MTTEEKISLKLHHPLDEFVRLERMPTIWCPGCGIGIALNAFLRSLKRSKMDMDKLVVISGIGCTGRVSGYMNCDGFHTTHGRAIPFALAVKRANPELTVVVFSGDGDLFSIGGNHFIHAARRNEDITVICTNNSTYGMTGGQAAPTTFVGANTTTTFHGQIDIPFNLVDLAIGSGARFVARYTSGDYRKLPSVFSRAIDAKGFSFVEVISPCPAIFGRHNSLGTGDEMIQDYLAVADEIGTPGGGPYTIEQTEIKFVPGEGVTKIPTGVFYDTEEE